MTMEMFLNEVRRAIVNNVTLIENLNIDSTSVDNDRLIVNIRTGHGRIQCVNEKCYHIAAHELAAHTIKIEEIWVGYDGEGSPWSDHMGGVIVDCTGLKTKGAIDKIVEKFIEKATM